MGYSHAKAEKKWNIEKDEEEKLLREKHFPEKKINDLRNYDRNDFLLERKFHEKNSCYIDTYFQNIPTYQTNEIVSISDMLDSIENEALFYMLKESDEVLLCILLLKQKGYTVEDISNALHLTPNAIYKRIEKFRKKLIDSNIYNDD